MVHQWFVVLILVFALFVINPSIKRIPKVAEITGKAVTRLPVIGRLTKMLYTATFARSLSTLYATGIPLLDAIAMGAEIVNNKYIEVKIREAVIAIRKGSSIAEAFALVDAFDPLLIPMTFAGGECGIAR